jgi:oligoendopeptidase F
MSTSADFPLLRRPRVAFPTFRDSPAARRSSRPFRRRWLDVLAVRRIVGAMTTPGFLHGGVIGAASLAFATATASMAKPETRVRSEIPAQYRWDFSAIYPDWPAWDAGMREMEAKMDAFAALKGTLGQGPAAVLKAYRSYDEIAMLQYKVYRYPQLQRDVDTRDQDVAGKFQRVGALFAKFGTATSWFTPELLNIPQAKMEKWIAETPDLQPYRFSILDDYRQQEHVLDEKGERLLSLASRFKQTPGAIFQELSTSDIKFPKVALADGKEVTLTPGTYQSVLNTNHNQADRAKAFEAYLKTYAATANTYAAIYNGIMQRGWFDAQARNYRSTLEAALENNAIPAAVVETLVETTRAGTAPLQRYHKLRKRLLGLDTYHLYDGSIPIFKDEKEYPYDSSKDLVISSVAPLGADYVAKYRKFVSGGRIDVYENEGKRSGAYAAGVYGVGPYLLLNYNDTLDAVFTFAHEAGHAMHTVLSYESQPFITSSYTIFVAEVASTTNERFLLNQLLQSTKDPKERFLLLQHAVDAIVGTFYTQVLFADFELQAHRLVEQDQPITADVLNGIYLRLMKEYHGDALTIDDLYQYTWTRIPHFFNTPYYVYQYATCFASSAKLFKDMTTGPEAERRAATERYLTLLRSGGNDYPMAQLQKAGVDLTRRETVQAVVDQMNELVAQMEMEAAKINDASAARR